MYHQSLLDSRAQRNMARQIGEDDRFDGLLMNLAQQVQGIEPMLDVVFGFLRRKTDFFKGPPGLNHEAGLAKAIETVHACLNKQADIYKKDLCTKKLAAESKKQKMEAAAAAKKAQKFSTSAANSGNKGAEPVIELGSDGFDLSPASPSRSLSSTSEKVIEQPQTPKSETVLPEEEQKDQGDEDDNLPPPVGNGGTVEGKYIWTQTLSEINMIIPIPENTRSRDINVEIRKNHLKVGLKQDSSFLDDDLMHSILVDDSLWTIEDGNKLCITLQKLNQMEWWDAVCAKDPKINIRKIQPENSSLGDLDGDIRQTVEKMMYDQRQKALNLPTSDEQKKLEIMKKFQAQHPEMDFSNCKFG